MVRTWYLHSDVIHDDLKEKTAEMTPTRLLNEDRTKIDVNLHTTLPTLIVVNVVRPKEISTHL